MDFLHSEKMPSVGVAMTTFPHFVAPGDAVEDVLRLMGEYKIRHVPVQKASEIVGIVSERSVHDLARHAVEKSAPLPGARVSDVMTAEPYVVDMHAPLGEVAAEMSRRQIGSAIVTHAGKLAGIFTTTDACGVLAELLRRTYESKGSGDDAA